MELMTTPPAGACGRLALVTFDWLPAWMLSTWGATWLATPAFDRLAARGVTLDAVMAVSDCGEATLAALVGGGCACLQRGRVASSLLLTDTPAVSREPRYRCFRDVLEEPAESSEGCQVDEEETALGRLFLEAEDAVPAMQAEDSWLWCHAGSLGTVWDAPLEFRDCLVDEDDPPPPRTADVPSVLLEPEEDPDRVLGIRQAFAGQVMLADRMLGRFLDVVDEEGQQGRPWTVVVAGLRGMPLGLHQQVGLPRVGQLGLLPYADLLQMPVIVADAAGRMAGQRYGGLLLAEDVAALCVDLLCGERASQLSGLLDRWVCEPRSQVVSTTERGVSVLTDEWRLIVERPTQPEADPEELPPRVFAKPDDFFEQVDVADRCPGVVEELLAVVSRAEPSGEPGKGG